MTPDSDASSRYDDTRRRYDELDMEEQARFLVEATATTVARGLVHAGKTVAEGLEEVIREARQTEARSGGAGEPGAAEPETAQQRSPRGTA
jgi:hypothetical protein